LLYSIIIIPIKKQLERAKLYSKTTERLLGDCALLFFVIAVLAAALDLNLISFLLINLFLVRLISEKNMGILSHLSILDKLRTNVNELNTCLIACYHEAIVIETTKIGLRNILKSLRTKYSVEKYFTKAQIPIYVTTLKSTFWLTAAISTLTQIILFCQGTRNISDLLIVVFGQISFGLLLQTTCLGMMSGYFNIFLKQRLRKTSPTEDDIRQAKEHVNAKYSKNYNLMEFASFILLIAEVKLKG